MEATTTMTARPGGAVERVDRRPFTGLILAQVLSVFGNSLTAIAIPWFVLDTTGSVARTGVVAAASVVPAIIAMAIGSAAVDRFGFRRMSIASDLLSMVTVAAIPLAYLTVGLSLPLLLTLVFLGALFDAPGSTARMALLPELARSGGISLERANGLLSGVNGLAMLAGPVAGGLLIGVVGASNVLWFNAATFALSVLIVTVLIPAVSVSVANDVPASGSYLDEVREGWRFVFAHPLIRPIMLAGTAINFVTAPVFGLILPAHVLGEIGRPQVLGFLMAGFGAGSLVGIGLYSWVGQRLPRFPLCVAGIGVFVVACAALAAALAWPVLLAVLFVVGLVSAPFNPIVFTVIQEVVPVELRGRATGAILATVLVASPVGLLTSGLLVEVAGLSVGFGIAAGLLALVTVRMARNPALRGLNVDRSVGPVVRSGASGHATGTASAQ